MGLPRLSGAEVIALLATLGFARVTQKGSHVKLKNGSGRTVIVPAHRELAEGTLRSVIRQAGLTVDEFVAIAKR